MSLIGLLPSQDGEDPVGALAAEVAAIAGGLPVADMLESADYAAPEGWQAAVEFGVAALKLLPRSKISISADRVAITAVSDSADQKRTIEAQLAQIAPQGLRTTIDISAPRPVLTPFNLRFVKDGIGARFDACSADTDRARDVILAAAAEAGAKGRLRCTVGLGVPTPRWRDAAAAGIAAVAAMGAGSVTFSDADVTLEAGEGVDQAAFDRAVGELRAALPDVFSLTATMPQRNAATAAAGPAEFTAALSAEGRVELRGRVTDDMMRAAVTSVAQAEFGAEAVYNATRTDDTLPEGWPVRVMAGIDALGELAEGNLTVRADNVTVHGTTGSTEAGDRISQILSARLGPGASFDVEVTYDEKLDPLAAIPEPQECVERLNAVLSLRKIPFEPGSSEIGAEAAATLDALAEVLETCPPLALEVGGHTDSQGSEGRQRTPEPGAGRGGAGRPVGAAYRRDAVVGQGLWRKPPDCRQRHRRGARDQQRIEFTVIGLPEPAADTPAPAPAAEGPATPDAPTAQGPALPDAPGPKVIKVPTQSTTTLSTADAPAEPRSMWHRRQPTIWGRPAG